MFNNDIKLPEFFLSLKQLKTVDHLDLDEYDDDLINLSVKDSFTRPTNATYIYRFKHIYIDLNIYIYIQIYLVNQLWIFNRQPFSCFGFH